MKDVRHLFSVFQKINLMRQTNEGVASREQSKEGQKKKGDAALHSAQTKADSDRRAAHALIDSLGLSS